MIKVSVIVPVYNTERYLRRCLDALTGQTLQDIEILLINDGSTDRSFAILSEYQKRFPEKIRVITKENGGQATARNLGIMEAKGEYIGFADSDDYVDETMFQKMYELAKRKQADYVECQYRCIDESGKKPVEIRTNGHIREYTSNQDMMIDPQVSPWNKLYRREILQEERLTFPTGVIYEDTAFYLKTIPYIRSRAYLDERLVNYMLHDASTMSSNKGKRVGDFFRVIDDYIFFYHERGLYHQYEKELEYFSVKCLLCSSLSRIGRVQNRKLRAELLHQTFERLSKQFPAYKSNPYFKGKTGLYIRFVNRWNCRIAAFFLGKVMKG